jgi:hypothetical protein
MEGLPIVYRNHIEEVAMADLEVAVVWLGLNFIVSGFGAYCGLYLKQMGHSFATQEDINRLVDQVRSVKKATQVIEAKISTEVWDRQKLWELKRDVLFEATRRVGEIEELLNTLNSILQVELKEPKAGNLAWMEMKIGNNKKWSKALAHFDETKLFIEVTCEKETKEAFDSYGKLGVELATAINKRTADAYEKYFPELIVKHCAVRTAVRNELGAEPGHAALTSQSSESLADSSPVPLSLARA